MRRLAPIGLSLVSLAMVAACTSAEEPADPPRTDDVQTPTTSLAEEDSASDLPPCTGEEIEVVGGFGEDPQVTVPEDCGPPTELVVVPIEPGEEPAVAEGDIAMMDYQLTVWSTGQIADSSFERDEPILVENVGQAGVIDGWNQGLVGLETGSRNALIVPPELAYGPAGSGQQLAGETLIFIVDVVETGPAA
ncbi:FKBP-type peptidyl-prolyl cis-trans isomerase [Actinoalloteichus hymeniacidonis]|uniref:Peptidyl-prolyl cis-trans isomerase n=1 Tax=Actinoalloteichus hymeniacidonis TaxID=340345 RepID=A0AAC9HPV0_9PSEU|nr:FKBP-type peptidyl-prolyl cis-trans isomerase [Actinoalloteichus hymeniacidonis]AOS63159.1 FKBP-type peptidyl-prolyl cis-trans isomerase [Actinoalloteichus hymeniacidonis]MBB5908804.1 peptidylprolyl isomerase [Actinoalloteichus hymeniacidonis]